MTGFPDPDSDVRLQLSRATKRQKVKGVQNCWHVTPALLAMVIMNMRIKLRLRHKSKGVGQPNNFGLQFEF